MKWMVPINQLDATQERAISDNVDDHRSNPHAIDPDARPTNKSSILLLRCNRSS